MTSVLTDSHPLHQPCEPYGISCTEAHLRPNNQESINHETLVDGRDINTTSTAGTTSVVTDSHHLPASGDEQICSRTDGSGEITRTQFTDVIDPEAVVPNSPIGVAPPTARLSTLTPTHGVIEDTQENQSTTKSDPTDKLIGIGADYPDVSSDDAPPPTREDKLCSPESPVAPATQE